MKKTILIVAAVIVLMIIGVLVWMYSQNQAAPAPIVGENPLGTLPGVVTGTVPLPASEQGPTISIGTPQGTVTVNNFRKTVLAEDEEYVTFANAAGYQLIYDTDTSAFVVDVTAGPLTTTRPAAEAALLNVLGVSESDACKLAVTVGVEPSVDPTYANQALRLSFCK
jgi:hypothetical protein